VIIDEPSRHFPDRIEIELHVDPDDLGQSDQIEVGTSLLVVGFPLKPWG
jgi:hypothetical protein